MSEHEVRAKHEHSALLAAKRRWHEVRPNHENSASPRAGWLIGTPEAGR